MNRSTVLVVLLFLGSGFFAVAHLQGWFAPAPRTETPERELVPEPAPRNESRRVSLGAAPLPEEPARQASRGVEARWADLNKEAIDALDRGELEVAVAKFETCLEAVPDEPVFATNLAEALARSARALHDTDPAAATERLERALELAPDRDDVRRVLERWRKLAAAEEDFAEDLSQHFRLSYDGERSDLLNFGYSQILRELETAYLEFGELFGVLPVEEGRPRISVVLYHREAFDDVTGLGDWAGGVFDGTVRIPVEDFAREKRGLTRVLRHELTHYFVAELGGVAVPGWLNEGLAQLLEWPFLPDRSRSAQRARESLAGETLFPLSALAGTLSDWDDAAKIRLAYAQSLAFTRHVEQQYGERVLYEMIAGCKQDVSCSETFRRRTGVELETLLGDLR